MANLSDFEFNAEKMQQVAVESRMYQLMDEWRDIRIKIEKTAKAGLFSTTFNNSLQKETRQRLEEAGFKVKSESCRDGSSYTIIGWEAK